MMPCGQYGPSSPRTYVRTTTSPLYKRGEPSYGVLLGRRRVSMTAYESQFRTGRCIGGTRTFPQLGRSKYKPQSTKLPKENAQ